MVNPNSVLWRDFLSNPSVGHLSGAHGKVERFRNLWKAGYVGRTAIVSCGGYRWDLWTCEVDGTTYIAAAVPHGVRNDRGRIFLQADGTYDHAYYCFNHKLLHAAMVLGVILSQTNDLDAIYKALSLETGCCAICGAHLTDELSVDRGIGPECWKKIWTSKKDVERVIEKRLK